MASRATTGKAPYGRIRAGTLAAVYVLIGLHVAHWKLRGSTLAPLEFNELMYTLELGVITAGFLLMMAASLSVLVFGRFFCSWGCHILALEDLAAWILDKFGVHPKPIRSRLLLLVPFGAAAYMFIWPQVERTLAGNPMPALHLRVDGEGWASFVTNDFWRNLPGPGITLLTFALCGFVIVYFLGTRSFCRYVCPYGAVFSLADRVAPGRIRERFTGACLGCAKCTAVCSSGVRVHEEILAHGQVVDPNCLKDLDCVSVCPEDAIAFGFVRPSRQAWHRSFVGGRAAKPVRARTGQILVGKRYDFTWGEEVGVAVAFLTTTLIFRGLYERVPFLLATTIGVLLSIAGVVAVRLIREPDVRLARWRLRRGGRLSRTGRTFAVCAALLAGFWLHSGWIRIHEVLGGRAYAAMGEHMAVERSNPPPDLLETASRHAELVERWGLVRTPELHLRLASIYSFDARPDRAAESYENVLALRPDDHGARLRYADVLRRLGRTEAAVTQLRRVSTFPQESKEEDLQAYVAGAQLRLGSIALHAGDRDGAVQAFRIAIETRPDHRDGYLALARACAEFGDHSAARATLLEGLDRVPGDPVLSSALEAARRRR